MKSWAVTDKGIVRKQNQDAYFSFCDDEQKYAVFVVCDGMGGANAGNVASTLAAERFVSELKASFSDGVSDSGTESAMKAALDSANGEVFNKSIANREYTGMGTTLVAAVVHGDRTTVMNVGDSRAYYISPKFGIRQVTRDHSVVEDLITRGDITRAESHNHPNKNLITRAVGTSPDVDADIFYPEVEEGSYILLCSDGLSNIVGDQELLYEVLRAGSIEEAGERLLDLGISRGAPDNITLVLFQK